MRSIFTTFIWHFVAICLELCLYCITKNQACWPFGVNRHRWKEYLYRKALIMGFACLQRKRPEGRRSRRTSSDSRLNCSRPRCPPVSHQGDGDGKLSGCQGVPVRPKSSESCCTFPGMCARTAPSLFPKYQSRLYLTPPPLWCPA